MRNKNTASFYIGYCDDTDGVEWDCEVDDGTSAAEKDSDISNCSLNQNVSSYPENFKSYMDIPLLERRSSDIDGLRASALENIDKDKLVCKSAECLLNDYGDIEPLNKTKKQRSCEILETNRESMESTNSRDHQSKRGHLRSKSANLVKHTIIKHLKKDKLKHGKSNIDILANPQITVTADMTENIRRKSRSLPRTLDASILEDRLKTVEDREINNLVKSEKRKRKREKIGSMFNTRAGDKKEIMRYDSAVKNMVLNRATSSINQKIDRTSIVVSRVIITAWR